MRLLGLYGYLCPPHEPEFEDVNVSATLQGLVPCVVGQVIVLVLLEQVAGVHLVAVLHQSLQGENQNSPITDCLKQKLR